MFNTTKRIILSIALLSFSGLTLADPEGFSSGSDSIIHNQERTSAERLIQEEERQKARQKLLQPEVDVRLDGLSVEKAPLTLIMDESPCFDIHSIRLQPDEASRFQFALDQAIKESKFTEGMCLGAESINALMTLAQNAVIAKGYTTTRILAGPQDLTSGVLVLTVVAGRVNQILFNEEAIDVTHVNRIRRIRNEFPIRTGDILNLRDIEQALENLKRVPTAEVDIQIVPAEQPNESDLVVQWSQRLLPLRLSVSADDSGSRSTGKYQGGLTLSWDNPLGLSDLFYASYNHNLAGAEEVSDLNGQKDKGQTRAYSLHYSVPYGYWLLAFNSNSYYYEQAVAGATQNYLYRGRSQNADVGLTRLLYRDSHRKLSANIKAWSKHSKSFIDDAEIAVQRRRVAGWSFGVQHKEYLGSTTLNTSVTYKRGTGMAKVQRAPEELFGEGTSRMKIITADISLNMPFRMGKLLGSYDTNVHLQLNKTPLLNQDQMSIGGRYSVRGFDGKTSLMAEKGLTWRNDLSWAYLPAHQVYLGLDAGYVTGPSSTHLLGKYLVGAALGVKGQFQKVGALNYDIFIGTPIYKPHNFRTANLAYGFNLSYSM